MAKRQHARPKAKPKAALKSRLPHIALRDIRDMILMITVFSLIVMGVQKMREPGTLPIRRVHFEGELVNVKASELRRIVAAQPLGGFFNSDLESIENALETLPWIDTASVRRQWPDAMRIHVYEQVPIARWGEDALLNVRGEMFYPPREGFPKNVPVLFGPEGRQRDVAAYFRRVAEMLQPIDLGVRALVQDERRSWRVLLSNGIQVELGRQEGEERMTRFARVYENMLVHKQADIAVVDLRYTNGFAVQWKPTQAKQD